MRIRTLIALTVVLFAGSPRPSLAASDGVLLLAHGGRTEWNDRVNTVAESLRSEHPVEVAFGMASRPAIQAAIERLEAAGVKRIVAIPLFISSNSSVVTSTEYLLGLRTDMPRDLAIFAKMSHGSDGGHDGHHAAGHGVDPSENTKPVKTSVPLVMTSALNAHPLVADILLSRAQAMSRAPAEEAVVLVAHGPVADAENQRWLADMAILARRMGSQTAFASIDYLTVRDDAPPTIRDQATAELRAMVSRRKAEGRRVLIVPLLMTYGGIEQGIRKRLEGLDYTMSDKALLPDDRIAEWIRQSVASAANRE